MSASNVGFTEAASRILHPQTRVQTHFKYARTNTMCDHCNKLGDVLCSSGSVGAESSGLGRPCLFLADKCGLQRALTLPLQACCQGGASVTTGGMRARRQFQSNTTKLLLTAKVPSLAWLVRQAFGPFRDHF
ncbi:hypothetical protein MRX96_049118 [Rhipicephalus microplus]